MTWQTKEIKNYIYQLRTKLTKAQTRKYAKARCQVGNKAMKTKLTNLLRGKERKKERIDMQSLIEADEADLYTLKVNCKGKRTVGRQKKE